MTIDSSFLENGPPQLQVPTCRYVDNDKLLVIGDVPLSCLSALVDMAFSSISMK